MDGAKGMPVAGPVADPAGASEPVRIPGQGQPRVGPRQRRRSVDGSASLITTRATCVPGCASHASCPCVHTSRRHAGDTLRKEVAEPWCRASCSVAACREGPMEVALKILGPLEVFVEGSPVLIGGVKRRGTPRSWRQGCQHRCLSMRSAKRSGQTAMWRRRRDRPRRTSRGCDGSFRSERCQPATSSTSRRTAFDAHRFVRLIRARRQSSPTDICRLLDNTLSLWAGPALIEFVDMPWALQHASAWEEMRRESQDVWFAAQCDLGHGRRRSFPLSAPRAPRSRSREPVGAARPRPRPGRSPGGSLEGARAAAPQPAQGDGLEPVAATSGARAGNSATRGYGHPATPRIADVATH